MLPADIIAKVRRDFGEDESIVILQLLKEVQETNRGGWYGDRVLRCIVFVADGSYDRFVSAVREDPRDLMIQAENGRRNFELPFSQNAV